MSVPPATSLHIRIAAVVPTHNRARLAARAIESVLAQSFPPAEVIVVDDGSTDDTADIVASFGNAVRYVRQDNAGGASARNRGVREAHEEWVAFLDSDDVWTPTHLERIAAAIRATEGAAALYFDDMTLPDVSDKTWWGIGGFAIGAEHVMVPDGADWVLREYQPMMLQSSVCKRALFLDEGGLWAELRNAHDTHFFLKLGIGRPLCAVQGVGSRQTEDAPPASRLTSNGMEGRRFINKTLAFRDILRNKPGLTSAQRRCLLSRLATSYWTLGRFSWENKNIDRFLAYSLRAFLSSPATTLRLAFAASQRLRSATDASSLPN